MVIAVIIAAGIIVDDIVDDIKKGTDTNIY